MKKFALYYGVKENGELEVISLKTRNEIAGLGKQCKEDVAKLGNKYKTLVVASDLGVHKCFKTAKVEVAEKPKAKTKKKKAE